MPSTQTIPSPAELTSLVSLDAITCETPHGSLGAKQALSLDLKRGEIGVVLGEIKSKQIFSLLTGRSNITSGQATVLGRTMDNNDHCSHNSWKEQIGYAFQRGGLLANLKIIDNVALPVRYHNPELKSSDLVIQALEQAKIPKKDWEKLPAMVSREVYKKALLARAAARKPPLLLLDDPSLMIRWTNIPWLMAWLHNQVEQGSTVLLGTDFYPFGLAVASWVLIPEWSQQDYDFQNNLDPDWLAVAHILHKGGPYEASA